jgi:hypothetical protein
MTTSLRTRATAQSITLITTPTPDQMEEWWNTLHSDPWRGRLLHDNFPKSLVAFCEKIHSGEMIFFLFRTEQDEVVCAMWAQWFRWNAAKQGFEGHIGGYAMPQYRGKPAMTAFRQGIDILLHDYNFVKLNALVRVDNRVSQHMTVAIGLWRVNNKTSTVSFKGQPVQMVHYELVA